MGRSAFSLLAVAAALLVCVASAEFRKVYALGEGEPLKLVRSPFPPSRVDFYRASLPIQAQVIPEGPSCMTIRWDPENSRFQYLRFGFGRSDLEGLLLDLGIARYAISGDPELLGTELPCD